MLNVDQRTLPRNSDHREFVLAQLRCASLRVRLLLIEVDTVGLGVRAGLIPPENAIEMLYYMGALDLVGQPPIGVAE
jgi:hypothetical protein